MEDDDLAANSQRLIDALDEFLRNNTIYQQLSSYERIGLRVHRERVRRLLEVYRTLGGYTERRPRRAVTAQAGPRVGMSMAGVMAAVAITAPAAGGAATGTGLLAVATVVGEVLLPIAAVVLVAAVLSKLTGGSLQEVMGKALVEAAGNLTGDLLALGAAASMMAITAAAAAALTDEQLLEQILKATPGALGVLIEELLRRFPHCINSINAFKDAAVKFNKAKTTIGNLAGGGRYLPNKWAEAFAAAADAKNAAWQAVLGCIALPGK